MSKCKGYSKMSKLLFVALLGVVCLTGCHGGIGWDRLQAPTGYPNKGDLDQSRQVEVGPEDAGRPAEENALMPGAEKNFVAFLECPGYPRSNVV